MSQCEYTKLPYWTIDGQFFILDGWAYGLTFNLKTVRMKEDKALKAIREYDEKPPNQNLAK